MPTPGLDRRCWLPQHEATPSVEDASMSGFHDLTMNDIEGRPVAFSTFAGKHCLIVNVASR
jgi:hypothetical protein